VSALPEGLQAVPTILSTGGRVALALWALPLLVASRRLPRFTVGSIFLPIALTAGWLLLSPVSYPLALAVAFALFAFAMLVYAFVPRLAMAVACSWLFLSVYASHLYFTGAFEFNRPLGLGLFAAGILFGALFPSFSLSALGPALASLLLVGALPVEPAFLWTLLVALVGFAWQALLLPALGRPRVTASGPPPPSLREKRKKWTGTLAWGASALVVLVVCIAVLAPAPDPAVSPNPGRIEVLRKSGGLDRPGLLFSKENAYYLFGKPLPVALVGPRGALLNRLLLPVLGRSPGRDLETMRTVKDDSEIAKMRLAAAITSRSFEDVARLIKPGANEADLEKAILASFEKNGANGVAFRCVVGSGRNATLPHYMDNNAELKHGLVVIDIGCSVDGYASDMTRTFPVSGKLSAPERELVATVIAAGDAARAMLKPGVTELQLDKTARAVIEKAGFGPYFTHGLGHPVGLDVHDSWIRGPLKPGMVITIEPGIYVPAGSKADKKYWDLGVRVEDSYLITKDGYDELTHYPKMPGDEADIPEAVPLNPAGQLSNEPSGATPSR
jgi:hypothetical protein